MKRAVLITGHFPRQKRRPSMLWVSDLLQADGWHFTHVTVGYSWLSRLHGDVRLRALDYTPIRGTHDLSDTLTALYDLPLAHPFRTRFHTLNRALDPISHGFIRFWGRRLRQPLAAADLVVCESGPPVLLGPIIAKYAPRAARIYRVSDDIRLLNAPDAFVRAEEEQTHHFTRISTASPHIAARFATHPHVTLDPVGIATDALKTSTMDPFHRQPDHKIAVCAGTTLLDIPALVRIATQRPAWDIHILGRLRSTPPDLPNITWHGEQSFEATLAHVAHADIGLAPYIDTPGVEYQTTNSNRILLYRHFGLPTLGPDRLCHPDVPSIIGYSAPDALERCENWVKSPEAVPDWSQLARRIAQNEVTDPPSDVSIVPDVIVNPRVNIVPALASKA